MKVGRLVEEGKLSFSKKKKISLIDRKKFGQDDDFKMTFKNENLERLRDV